MSTCSVTIENGWYETENKVLQGVIGTTYILYVQTVDGKEYESTPVKMAEVPDIEDVHFIEEMRNRFDGTDEYQEDWLTILVDSKAPSDGDIYLRWKFDETWEFEMPLYITIAHNLDSPGNIYYTREMVELPDEKRVCWITKPSDKLYIESTVSYPDHAVKNFVIQSIGPPSDKLNIQYSILVKQYAITKDIYTYFKQLREANNETGGIYGRLPQQIIGNITCCNGKEDALGYFIASAVKSKRIFISPSEHQVRKGPSYPGCGWETPASRYQREYYYGKTKNDGTDVWSTNNYCTDCRLRGTHVKPDFWK